MILRLFPDVCPLPGLPNCVVQATARDARYEGVVGPLSIKCVLRGREVYRVGRASYAVEPGSFLILNRGQTYSCSTSSSEPTETLTVFFHPEFADTALRTLVATDPLEPEIADDPLCFFERLYPLEEPMLEHLRAITSNTDAASREWLEERFWELLGDLLAVQRMLAPEIRRVPARSLAKRRELYRRLYQARDFLHSCYRRRVSLEEAARTAGLSPYHFLRLFRRHFGMTPHEHLTRRRIERARDLLAAGDLSVTEICSSVGFESPGSFAALFKRRVGVSPREYRKLSVAV